jgi:hypothetical protein
MVDLPGMSHINFTCPYKLHMEMLPYTTAHNVPQIRSNFSGCGNVPNHVLIPSVARKIASRSIYRHYNGIMELYWDYNGIIYIYFIIIINAY